MEQTVIAKKSTFWVETDLEPDDTEAIFVLSDADYYVVGEGNANIKYNRMLEYCQLMGNKPAVIIQGLGSDKDFKLDGKEFDLLPNNECHEEYMPNFIKFAKSDNPIMFSLKPMRELMAWYREDSVAIRILLSNVDLYVYGGFNFRSLLKNNMKELPELLQSFKNVYLYESFFATGKENSIDKHNCPVLYKYLMDHKTNPYIEKLLRLTYNWNTHMYEEASEALKNTNLSEKVRQMKEKIVKNIKSNEDFQFVLADFALAAIYRDIKPVPMKNIKFDSWFTEFEETTDPTNMFFYKNISIKTIEELIIKYLEIRLQPKKKNLLGFSKYLSFLLRHGAIKKGYTMDLQGFVSIEELMSKNEITLDEIKEIVAKDSKKRFMLVERESRWFIKAAQGHSIKIEDPDLVLITDAKDIPVVVHGTNKNAYKAISKSGLNKMTRTHIHFSHGDLSDPTVISGIRKTANVLIYIDVPKAMTAGIKFYKSLNGVILSEGINGVIGTEYFLKVDIL